MGSAKNRMMEQQDLAAQVERFVINAGAVKPCANHDEVLEHQYDKDAERLAYGAATKAWQRGELGGTREDVMDAVKSVLDNAYPFGCTHPYCSDD